MRFGARRAVAALSVLGLCGCAMHDTVGHAQPAGPVAVFSDDFTGPAGTPPGGPWRFDTGGGGWGNNEVQVYTDDPGNVSLDGPGTWQSSRAARPTAATSRRRG